MLTESVLVSLASGLAGIGLTFLAIRALLLLAPADIPRLAEVDVDGTVFGFSLFLSVATGLIFGLAPAITSSGADPGDAMKSGGRGSEGLPHRRLRRLLVVSEIAIALLLLVGAGLLIRSFSLLHNVDSGFASEGILTARLQLPPLKFSGVQIAGFYDQLLERVRSLPGVSGADVASTVLLNRLPTSASVVIEDRLGGAPDPTPIPYDSVSPGFFRTMRIALVRGRGFSDADDARSMPVVIVNEAFARRYWPNEDPLGKRLTFGNPRNPDVRWSTIVGIVADARRSGLDRPALPETYFPLRQSPVRSMQLLVRAAAGEPEALAGAVKDAVWAIDKDLPVGGIRTMESLVAERVAQRRFNMTLLGVFAAVALALAAVGIYGVMSYSVTQRAQEIGIRLAVGARPRAVMGLVVREGVLLTAAGIGLGLAGCAALTRLLASQLYGVTVTDAVTYAAVAAALAAVALLASFVPARRAARVDPLRAIRYE